MSTRQQRPTHSAGSAPEHHKHTQSTFTPLSQTPAQRFPADAANLSSPDAILNLQHLIGNQAVQRMLRAQVTIQRSLSGKLGGLLNDPPSRLFEALKKDLEVFAESEIKDEQKLAERREAYATLKEKIAQSKALSETEKTVILGLLLEGSLEWQNTDDSKNIQNDFSRYFLLNQDNAHPENNLRSGTLNCWESVLFIAYTAGILNRKQIHDLHMKDPRMSVDAVANFLGYSRRRGEYTKATIETMQAEPGEIIFYTNASEAVAHIALALGRTQILSLWNEPEGITSVQRISAGSIIKNLVVSVAAAPWSTGKSGAESALEETDQWRGEEFGRQVENSVRKLLERIPSKPTEAAALEDLTGFLRKISADNFGALDLDALLKIVEKEDPKLFVDPQERFFEFLGPYFKEDFRKDVREDIKNGFKKTLIEKLIHQIFNTWEIGLAHETPSFEEQAEAALSAYNDLLMEPEKH